MGTKYLVVLRMKVLFLRFLLCSFHNHKIRWILYFFIFIDKLKKKSINRMIDSVYILYA
uniref:Uncharacterized protein n=1 Tax=Rhizophora mucronata TaxID=61149 RepID=A0A2P2JE89_RHIMU